MSVKISFEGLDALVRTLESGTELKKVKKVVKYHGAKLQRTMQRKAVFRGHYEWQAGKGRVFVKPTGFLKRSISAPQLAAGGFSAIITVSAEYSAYVELGTRYMEAQPYAKPALDEVEPSFLDDIGKAVME